MYDTPGIQVFQSWRASDDYPTWYFADNEALFAAFEVPQILSYTNDGELYQEALLLFVGAHVKQVLNPGQSWLRSSRLLN